MDTLTEAMDQVMVHFASKLNPKSDLAKYLNDKGASWANLAI